MAKSGRPKTNPSAAVTTDTEVKTDVSVESVKPETPEVKEEKPADLPKEEKPAKTITFEEKVYTVTNKDKAGKSVTGSTGEIITFDENGIAKVCMKDAEHLSRVPGYTVSEN